MKMLYALAVAAVAATTLSVPASAGTIGCDEGAPMNSSVKATNCHDWTPGWATSQPTGAEAFAYGRPSRTIVAPSSRYLPDLENEGGGTGVSGGAAN